MTRYVQGHFYWQIQILKTSQAAEIISEVIGKEVVHKRVSEEEALAIRTPFIGEDYAKALGKIEVLAAGGSEEAHFKRPETRRGKTTLKEIIEANKDALL